MSDRDHVPLAEPSMRQQRLVLWLAILIIAAASFFAFLATNRLIAASKRVEETQTTLIEVNRFMFDLKNVESAARGYLLTRDDGYLKVHNDGIASAKATMVRLDALPKDASVEEHLPRLFALANKRLQYSHDLVTQHSSPDEFRANMAIGSSYMDRFRQEAAAINDQESARFQLEREAVERQSWITNLVLGVGVSLCLIIIAWLFSIRGREVQRRRQLEADLRALNLDLEDRVQERTSEVKKARDLLDAVVENLPDMIFLKEASEGYRYILINAAGEQLLGRPRAEILGKIDHELFPREEADLLVKDSEAVTRTGKGRVFPERKLTTGKGRRTVESRSLPIGNGGAAPSFILGIMRDVTDARSLEEQLRQLQRMDAIGRLTGGVAHDFNNLLAIIHGNSELLQGRVAAEPDSAEMVDDILGAAGRGAELVKRLLAFARMQHLEPETVDLNARLPNILSLLQRTLGESVTVRTKPAKDLWLAIVDPTQVDDAVINLAINARDAMPAGGTLTIETENIFLDEDYTSHHVEVQPGEYVMLAVSDTGTGMTAEAIARAFEPFFTTKEEGQGTGLGLSQVFGWVKQSGGHIKIYSELGHGTTVKLYLPRSHAMDGGKIATEADVAPPNGDETIFLVEDNPNVRKTIIRQLHDLGYKTIEADSSARAIEMIRDGAHFDLLLSDVIMPGGMTGYELAEEVRIDRPDLKVLFVSGYTEFGSGDAGGKKNGPLLSKPFRKQDLGRAVRAALDDLASGLGK